MAFIVTAAAWETPEPIELTAGETHCWRTRPRLYRAGQAARTATPGAMTWRDYPVEIEGYAAVAAAVDAAAGAPSVEPPGSRAPPTGGRDPHLGGFA